MPTRDVLDPFWHDYDQLTPEQQAQFRAALRQFVEDLRRKQGFRASLRVKGVRKARGVFEMTWAPDGRATFHYGPEQIPGEPHIVWRRIGGHEIFKNP